MKCIYSLACFFSDTNDIMKTFSCLVCIWFQYLLYKFRRCNKLRLNSHPIKNLLTFESRCLVKFGSFYPQLSLEIAFPALKLDANLLHKYENFNLKIWNKYENWQFNHKLVPPLLHVYQAWKSIVKIWQNMKLSGIQKFQFSNSFVNWEKFGSTA